MIANSYLRVNKLGLKERNNQVSINGLWEFWSKKGKIYEASAPLPSVAHLIPGTGLLWAAGSQLGITVKFSTKKR